MTRLTLSVSDTLKLYNPAGFGGALPGSDNSVLGQAAPAPTPSK